MFQQFLCLDVFYQHQNTVQGQNPQSWGWDSHQEEHCCFWCLYGWFLFQSLHEDMQALLQFQEWSQTFASILESLFCPFLQSKSVHHLSETTYISIWYLLPFLHTLHQSGWSYEIKKRIYMFFCQSYIFSIRCGTYFPTKSRQIVIKSKNYDTFS